jgi:hypothetical protein
MDWLQSNQSFLLANITPTLRSNAMTTIHEWTRINHDVNGNSRHVVHFLALLTTEERKDYSRSLTDRYALAVKRAHKLGGSKFHNKQYGGGIVFQATESDLEGLEQRIAGLLGEPYTRPAKELGELTMLEFNEADHDAADQIARKQGYGDSTAYTTTSSLNGLYLVPTRPTQKSKCIVKTKELGFCVVEVIET